MRGSQTDVRSWPIASAKLGADFSIPNNVDTAIVWSALELALSGAWSMSPGGAIIFPEDGIYIASANTLTANLAAASTRQLSLWLSGLVVGGTTASEAAGLTADLNCTSKPFRAKRGDTLWSNFYQNSGVAMNVIASARTFLAARRIG